EFLGEARCLVLDVKPKGNSGDGFSGRIWVEDRDYNVVRFNGISLNLDHTLASAFRKKVSFHVDSWRVNVAPGLWLPAYVYSDEDLSDNPKLARMARIKSQVRLWGYESKGTQKQQQFTDILIDEPSVRDTTEGAQQMSPILSQRKWEQEAEDNVLDRLEEAAADAKVIELLKSSPYKEKLSNAGLFLRAIDGYARQLPNLIQPHIGEQIAGGGQAVRLGELMQQAPELAPERLDQIAA